MNELKGYRTSYVGLFQEDPLHAEPIEEIEIPRIQRDYAQGRTDANATEVRRDFVAALLDALEFGQAISLDFVYGKQSKRTLIPLDGQQRLTTLFLLHWYLGSLSGKPFRGDAWTRFTYETRSSARSFCQRLGDNPLPAAAGVPSKWITDQPWFPPTWTDDPSIAGMLVMLDAIHHGLIERPGVDPHSAWQRLTDVQSPAIWFYLLPLDDLDSDADMYITMNSRGKPLTEFENFKARFEQDIRESPRAQEFAERIDTVWSQMLWAYHTDVHGRASDDDRSIDDEFIRYFDFITALLQRFPVPERDVPPGGVPDSLARRAEATFSPTSERGAANIDFLFDAFDTWVGTDIAAVFESHLTTAAPGNEGYDPGKVVLFKQWARTPSRALTTDLFDQCVHRFDSSRVSTPEFTLAQSLLLYAFLVHRTRKTEDFPRRLRMLRNLVAASDSEIRREAMVRLLPAVEVLVTTGDLTRVEGFRRSQVADEQRKQAFLAEHRLHHPELEDALFRLEDHPILGGTLSAFELDAATFRSRAAAFGRAFASERRAASARALLATGEYQRPSANSTWLLGADSVRSANPWRALLTGADEAGLAQTREVLGRFLDGVTASELPIDDHLENVTEMWLTEREAAKLFDWRYYLVKYFLPAEEFTGIVHTPDGHPGYVMCALRRKTTSGVHWDPILLAVKERSGVSEAVENPEFRFEWEPHWLRLSASQTGVRSTPQGFALQAPPGEGHARTFRQVCEKRDDIEFRDGELHLLVPQSEASGTSVDSADRVQTGARLLDALVGEGL